MSILILYLSKHGTVEEVVKMMQKISGEDVELRQINSHISGAYLDKFDSIIVGGSIHIGKAQKKLIRFCNNYSHYFREKKSGVFLCTLTPPGESQHYLEETFPKEVLDACHAVGLFGGAVKFENMNFLERSMMKKISGEEHSFSRLDTDRIAAFIESF